MRSLIRRMKTDDIGGIQKVAKTTWKKIYIGIIPLSIQETFLKDNYSDTAMNNRMERSIVLVADFDGVIQGVVNFFPSKQNPEEA